MAAPAIGEAGISGITDWRSISRNHLPLQAKARLITTNMIDIGIFL
jgi:hypothetical protein